VSPSGAIVRPRYDAYNVLKALLLLLLLLLLPPPPPPPGLFLACTKPELS